MNAPKAQQDAAPATPNNSATLTTILMSALNGAATQIARMAAAAPLMTALSNHAATESEKEASNAITEEITGHARKPAVPAALHKTATAARLQPAIQARLAKLSALQRQ